VHVGEDGERSLKLDCLHNTCRSMGYSLYQVTLTINGCQFRIVSGRRSECRTPARRINSSHEEKQ
jgi:hypothetical protein